MSEITLERLKELQSICSKLDPAKRRKWKLELYTLRDGREILTESIDLKKADNVRKRQINTQTD